MLPSAATRKFDDGSMDVVIMPWVKRLAIDIIGDISFGVDLNALEQKDCV
jgi:hypothetical protein